MAFNININKTVTVEIESFTFTPNVHVTIVLSQANTHEKIVRNVTGAELAELLSANPSWAPTKPAGTFRLTDLAAFLQAKGL